MRITEAPLQLDPLLAATANPASGALVIFAGAVRNHHEGRAVCALHYTAHVGLAEKLIAAIERETLAKFDIHCCRVVHRIGRLDIGEVAIYAVVRAAHRSAAFTAADYVVHAVKHRAPIWKEEFYADGTSRFVDGCCLAGADTAVPHRTPEETCATSS